MEKKAYWSCDSLMKEITNLERWRREEMGGKKT